MSCARAGCERIYDKPERQADLQQLRCAVQSRFSGLEVLEVACGTGYWTELLASSAAWVFATDINEEVLTLARAKAVDRRRVVFQREDAYGCCSTPSFPEPSGFDDSRPSVTPHQLFDLRGICFNLWAWFYPRRTPKSGPAESRMTSASF